MNKKGFTLIELLAVIVILAIIATIAIPIVLDVIGDIRKSSTEISMKNIEKAANLYFQNNRKNGNIILECNNGKCKNDNKQLKITGKSPESGRILIDKEGNVTYEDIVLNGFNCYKEHDKFVCDSKKIRKTYNESNFVINSQSEYTLFDYNIYGNSIQNEETLLYESVGDKTVNLCPGFYSQYPTAEKMEPYKFPIKANTTYSINFNPEIQAYKTVWLYDNDDNITQLVSYAYVGSSYNKMVVIPKQDGYMSVGILDSDAKVIVAEGMYFILNTTQQNNLNNNGISTSVAGGELPYELYGNHKILVKVEGENLIDVSKSESGYLNNLGVLNNSDKTMTTDYIKIMDNEKYILEYKYDSLANNSTRNIIFYDENKNIISNKVITYSSEKKTNIISSDINGYIRISYDVNIYDAQFKTHFATNIYLDEPLRGLGEKADYIDFKNGKVVRYIEEDSLGNLKVLPVPKEEKIELPEILLKKGINNIEIETSVKPSKVELEYYK